MGLFYSQQEKAPDAAAVVLWCVGWDVFSSYKVNAASISWLIQFKPSGVADETLHQLLPAPLAALKACFFFSFFSLEAARVGTHPSCRLWVCVCVCVYVFVRVHIAWKEKAVSLSLQGRTSALFLPQQWFCRCLRWESCSSLWRLLRRLYHKQNSICRRWVGKAPLSFMRLSCQY